MNSRCWTIWKSLGCAFFLALAVAVLGVNGCESNSKSTQSQAWVARCGQVTISAQEFQAFLQQQTRRNQGLQLSPRLKRKLLERLVEKKLLLQEAEKLKLDQDPKFVQDLQEMRDQALMKRLFAKKAAELEKQATVTDDEVRRYYEELGEGVRFRYLPVTKPAQVQKLIREWSAGRCEGAVDSGMVNEASLREHWKICLQGLPTKKPELVSLEGKPFLVELLERKELTPPPLGQVRKEISRKLLARKKAALMQAWVNSLKEKNPIKINEAYFKR